MRELQLVEFVTLDGVMQGFGSADEDRDGGFEHGGWGAAYADDVQMQQAGEALELHHGVPVRSPHLREDGGVLAAPAAREPDGCAPQRHREVCRLPDAHGPVVGPGIGARGRPRPRRRGVSRPLARGASSCSAAGCSPASSWPRASSTATGCSCTRCCSAPASGCSTASTKPRPLRLTGCTQTSTGVLMLSYANA